MKRLGWLKRLHWPARWLIWCCAWAIIDVWIVQTLIGSTDVRNRLEVTALVGCGLFLAFSAGRRVEAEHHLRVVEESRQKVQRARNLVRGQIRVVARHIPSMDAGRDIWN